MAVINVPYPTSGLLTIYSVIIKNSDGKYWNGSTFETFNTSNWTTYVNAHTESGTTGLYALTFPAGITSADVYTVVTFLKLTGSFLQTDTKLAIGEVVWDGTKEVTTASIANAILDLTDGIETGETFRQSMRLLRSVIAGVSTETSGTIVFKRKDGTTTSLTVVHDGTGSRTSSTVGTL